nr:MAG TPA: Protein of unknown function (DUF983) [Caudoviricetes sp.]
MFSGCGKGGCGEQNQNPWIKFINLFNCNLGFTTVTSQKATFARLNDVCPKCRLC